MPRQSSVVAIWFNYETYDQKTGKAIPDPDGGRVEIQNLTDDDIAQIREKAVTSKTVFNPKSMETERYQTTSLLLDRQETAVRAVRNFEKFYSKDGDMQECSEDNIKSWACNNNFMIFLNKKLPVVMAEAKKRTDEKIKNS